MLILELPGLVFRRIGLQARMQVTSSFENMYLYFVKNSNFGKLFQPHLTEIMFLNPVSSSKNTYYNYL
jgi:hypothetical protein